MKKKSQSTIPRFIYFAGVDGSGKSTYVEMLIKEFERRGLKAKRVWLRFNYFFAKPVLLYCRLTGLTRRPVRSGRKISVHDFYKSPLIGNLVQYLHFIDTCLNYFIKVVLSLKFTKTYILCDRFVYDILADFMIENRDLKLPEKFISRLLLSLIPRDALILYFKVDKEEIIRRKPEVLDDDEDYDLKYKTYCVFEGHIKADIINNNKEHLLVLQEVVDKVFSKEMPVQFSELAMKNPSETTVKCFIPSSIPMCLRWLFPYKVKSLPIPIHNDFSYYLFQNKITLTLINWLFQGMRGMGQSDLAGKICLEIALFTIAVVSIKGNLLFCVIVAFLIAHTLNWLFNSHFWVFGRYLGITRTNIERFPKYLRGVMNRLQNCSAIDSIIVIGGASRKEGVKITSDIDIFIIRKRGLLNGFIAVLITIKERILAVVTKFPLDLYLYDSINSMNKHRDDERAFILKDVHGQVKAYYKSKGRKVAGFKEYERAAKKTS